MIEARDLVMDYTAGMARVQADHSVTGVMPRGAGTGGPHPYAAGGTGYAMPAVHTLALNHVNFDLAPGETVAVMGPSGSGKSTLLNLLGLLDHPNTGTYRLEGRDVTTLSPEEQARVRSERIGFVFQSFHLVPRLTAAENIALPMTLAGIAPAERAKRVKQALKDYGLTDRATHRPNELSGGQRQRVAIARATIMQPAMILADEPTGNLDRATGEEVMRLLEELNSRGVTLIVVTHDTALGARARRQLLMEDGELRLDSK